jgi:uncharacterized metal-binding protein YceD (DUF177 family)
MPVPAHNSEGRLIIDLQNFPDEGRDFAGEIERDVFQLEPGGPRPKSPLEYELHVERRGGWLVVTGTVGAAFEMTCVRCLEPFPEQVTLDGYFIEEELAEKTASVDLTDRVREDILLALPGYPHCDESNVASRVCPAADRFLPASSYSPDDDKRGESGGQPDVWNALDKLNIEPAPDEKKLGDS